MQKKIVVHMYLKNGKAVTGFDGKELLDSRYFFSPNAPASSPLYSM